jgi:hypothetical protein
MNDINYFWKNFRLGTELQVAGNFIYNGLNFLDKLDNFNYEENIFEILYSLSVGIERLEKIVIILIEHNENVNQKTFEKKLITHNLEELLSRIKQTETINIGKAHNKFIKILTTFYHSYRYNRFNRDSVHKRNGDKFDLVDFLKEELKIEEEVFGGIKNTKQIKKFIGKIVITISSQLYDLVRKHSFNNGTFTYEIRYGSKAFKIFIAKESSFEIENNFKKEILIKLINNGFDDEFIESLKTIEPIKLEDCNSSHYIKYLLNSDYNQEYIDEYEYLIEERIIPNSRREEIEPIGESYTLESEINDSDLGIFENNKLENL